MDFRRAELEDIEPVSLIWLDMVKEMRPDWKPNVQWWRGMAAKMMAGGMYTILLAFDKKTLAGFLDFIVFPEPSTGNIHGVGQHLYVLPEYRYTGVASGLYRRAVSTAKAVGITTIEMFCFVDDQKKWAKCGYNPARTLMRKGI